MSYGNGSIAEASEQAPGPFETGYAEAPPWSELEQEAVQVQGPYVGETPFVAGEAFDGAGEAGFAGDLHELLAELYDSEFDQHLLELSEAAAEAANESPFVQGETASPDAERYVREWLEPLHRSAETMLEAMGETLADKDLARLTETEVDELLAPHEPIASGANPVFENFLGGLWKKAKGIVHGAVNLAKKGISAIGKLIPINLILDRIKVIVRPLFERVLQMALNKLPPSVRPAAEQLKKRLFGETAEVEEDAGELEQATTADVSEVQREFDTNAASLLLAADEPSQDRVVAEAFEATELGEDPINDLAHAREQLAAELQELPPGGDPQPAVEHFIPAVMAVLPLIRTGISIIGRDRVVRFIAQFISSMIRPYVGDQAPALSQAIASTGLGMMSLEAPVDTGAVAANALAGTVEDTVREVSEAAPETLEHPELLEATVASAFDRAAARNFPPSLLKPQHRHVHAGAHLQHARDHRDHHHHHHHHAMWVRLPHARWYRRYTKALTARITPTIARQVRVFGGITLEAYLRDHYGVTGELTAPAHLYESLPGATLGRIAAHEKRTPGLGHARAYWKLLPLTPEAAGMLFGEPGLGRRVDHKYLERPQRIAVGERFYYLELHRVAGAKAGVATGGTPGAAVAPHPHSSQVNVRVDLHKHTVHVLLHLSEAEAQDTAAKVRSKQTMAVSKLLRDRLDEGLRLALSPHPAGHLRWTDPSAGAGAMLANAVHPPLLAEPAAAHAIAARVLGWAGGPLIEFATHHPEEVAAAADRHAQGITFDVRLSGVAPDLRGDVAPTAFVELVPGFRHA